MNEKMCQAVFQQSVLTEILVYVTSKGSNVFSNIAFECCRAQQLS